MTHNTPLQTTKLPLRMLALVAIILCGLLLTGAVTTAVLIFSSNSLISSSVAFLQSMQLAQTLFIFIIPSLIMAWLISPTPLKWIGLSKKPTLRQATFTILSLLTMLPFLNMVNEWNQSISFPAALSDLEQYLKQQELEMNQLTLKMLGSSTIGGLLISIFLAGVCAGISEEMLFRGVLQNLFLSSWKRKALAVGITAFIFSAIHMQFYGLFPRFIMGVYFGYLFVWSGSLWLPIIAHFLNNSLAAYLLYIQTTNQPSAAAQILESSDLTFAIFGFAMSAGLLYLIFKENQSRQKTISNPISK